jgi:hypothetical protein
MSQSRPKDTDIGERELLRRMLNAPPQPHKPKAAKKAKEKKKKIT